MSQPFAVTTKITQPISELTPLEQAVVFAELSAIVYYSELQVSTMCGWVGFDSVQKVEAKGVYVYLFSRDQDVVLVFQGTNNLTDGLEDLRADLVDDGTFGKVHCGFKACLDDVWPALSTILQANKGKTFWLAGHSLGAAMAGILAARAKHGIVEQTFRSLHTFGMPRAADSKYLFGLSIPHYRYVHHHDLVPTVPEVWMGYAHFGTEFYIRNDGSVGKANLLDKASKLMLRVVDGLHMDCIADHSIYTYCELLQAALKTER